jgi:hypothetical protein
MNKKAYFKMSFWARVRLTHKYPYHPLAIKGWYRFDLTGITALEFLNKYSK